MKLFKTFFVASALALVVSIGSLVHAQTLVATVNIENARVVSQVGNTFTLAFSVTNREGVQSGVRYGVQLVSETPKGQFVVDEYVFDEALTLSAGTVVDREVQYVAPAQLDGTYTLFLKSMNQNGFPFATAYVGKAVFTPLQKGVSIDRTTCKVMVGDEQYILSQTFSVQPGISPTLLCEATNYSGGPITVTPDVKAFVGSAYGSSADTVGATTTPIAFLIGERKTISFSLPKFSNPGTYYVTTTLSGNTSDTGVVAVKYGVAGATASIDNFSFDKMSYKKGDLAKMSLVWRASLADNSAKAKATPDVALSLSVTNAVGTKCVAPIEQMLSRASAVKNITVPVVANCANPKAVITLSDKDGVVLATKTFAVDGGTQLVSKSLMLGIIVGIIVILGVALVLHFRKRKDVTVPPAMPTMILLPFLVFVSVGMVAPKQAHADTYSYTTPEGDTIITEVNLDSATYSPNGQITVTASIENINNGTVPPYRSYPVRLTANNNNGTSQQIIPVQGSGTSLLLAPGRTSIYTYNNFNDFNAPSTAGAYAVNFTTSVDIGISVPTVTAFSGGVGWNAVGFPVAEAQVSSSAPATGEGISVRFDLYKNGVFQSQEIIGATLGQCIVYGSSCAQGIYGEAQGPALESYQTYTTKNVCIESYSSGLYVDPAWLCN